MQQYKQHENKTREIQTRKVQELGTIYNEKKEINKMNLDPKLNREINFYSICCLIFLLFQYFHNSLFL